MYAPTSNTVSHDNNEEIHSWVSFSFLYGYGVLLQAARALLLPAAISLQLPTANLSFGFHDSLANTCLQVFNVSLDVNVLTVAESSQDLTQGALYLSLACY